MAPVWFLICHACVGLFILKACEVFHATRDDNSSNGAPGSIFTSRSLRVGSSVWCFGGDKSSRICKFKNLCFDPEHDDYIFFHGSETILDGVPRKRFEPALLDLSSVDDHNTQYFNFVDFPVDSINSFGNITVLNGTSLLFHRLNPDNIMHVIHDDLLPLYHTLKQFSFKDFPVDWRLVFMEGRAAGEYIDLYKVFSRMSPLLKADIMAMKQLICFQHAIVGISKFTTWYQYGFKKPQGPLPNISITGSHIRRFTEFMSRQLNMNKTSSGSLPTYLVLYSRKKTRLILNEVDLAMALAAKFSMQIVQVSMESHTIREQIQLISQAKGLVGMHGSALILSMFLPPGAVLMELYPFGVNPDHYTPYRSLTEIPGIDLKYAAWRNMMENNSVTHDNKASNTGGIQHLSEEEQRQVQSTKEVPRHFCCDNPYWLYRIYQDTFVDIPSFLYTADSVLTTMNNDNIPNGKYINHAFLPGRVRNILCSSSLVLGQPSLSLSWMHPINHHVFETSKLRYEIWIQENGKDEYTAYMLHMTSHLFTAGLKHQMQYSVWIRCLVNDTPGPFAEMKLCKTL